MELNLFERWEDEKNFGIPIHILIHQVIPSVYGNHEHL